jgi:flagellar motor switch/type III secretory pathway protein FliN
VCGVRDGATIERVDDIANFTTFFELLIDRPVRASIGVAVSRDPAPEPRGALDLADLEQVHVPVAVRVDLGAIPASSLAALQPGSLLPMAPGALRGRLYAGGRTLAYGTCGVRHGWYALAVEEKGQAI